MRSFIWLLMLLFAFHQIHSQEMVSLKSIPFPIQSNQVNILGVFDNRLEKDLGLHKNLSGEQVKLYLNKGAAQAIKAFYGLSLDSLAADRSFYIRIEALDIQESKRRMNSGITSVGRAHVELVFLEMDSHSVREVFRIQHNEDEVFEITDRQGLYATHERRIRAALEYCMLAFLSNYEKRPAEVVHHFTPPKGGFKVDSRLGQWFNLVTVKAMRSAYFAGYGISYTGFVDSKKGWIRPYETSFEVGWSRTGIAEENGYKNVNSYVFRPELYFFYKRLFPGVYASMSTNVPVGYEILQNLDDSNSWNFVIGIGASQGIRIIPWRKKGLVLGLDFFQQFETSEVYRTDLGFELVIGASF